MTAPELADCWTPVPLRWRHVQPGDVIVGKGGTLLTVESTGGPRGKSMAAHLYGHDHPFLIDPDETVRVLVPIPERDALTIAREVLGARVEARRTAQAPGVAA